MTAVGDLKWIEAGLLLAAGVAFGWWQLRDIRREQDKSRAQREAAAQNTSEKDQNGSP